MVACNAQKQITSLTISGKKFKTTPDFSKFPSLETLALNSVDLGNNKDFTTVYSNLKLSNCPNLKTLKMSGCSLTGAIPCQLPSFYLLDLSNNRLNGQIPDCFNAPKRLYLSDNQISGSVPTKVTANCNEIYLAGNPIAGLSSPAGPTVIDLQRTRLTNDFDLSLVNPKITKLLLTGKANNLPKLTSFTVMTELFLTNGQISAALPPLPASLLKLDLQGNRFTGQLDASNLQSCTMQGNNAITCAISDQTSKLCGYAKSCSTASTETPAKPSPSASPTPTAIVTPKPAFIAPASVLPNPLDAATSIAPPITSPSEVVPGSLGRAPNPPQNNNDGTPIVQTDQTDQSPPPPTTDKPAAPASSGDKAYTKSAPANTGPSVNPIIIGGALLGGVLFAALLVILFLRKKSQKSEEELYDNTFLSFNHQPDHSDTHSVLSIPRRNKVEKKPAPLPKPQIMRNLPNTSPRKQNESDMNHFPSPIDAQSPFSDQRMSESEYYESWYSDDKSRSSVSRYSESKYSVYSASEFNNEESIYAKTQIISNYAPTQIISHYSESSQSTMDRRTYATSIVSDYNLQSNPESIVVITPEIDNLSKGSIKSEYNEMPVFDMNTNKMDYTSTIAPESMFSDQDKPQGFDYKNAFNFFK